MKHQVTHYPFQDWCPICVKNAAKNKPHKKVTNIRECEVFSLDYMYMTSKPTTEELAHPILVIKARVSGGVWALPVTRKGPYLNNIVQRVNNIITSVGCPKIVIKADQEPAMISLQKEIRKELWNEVIEITNKVKDTRKGESDDNPGGVVILENSPVGESQSNGIVEHAIQEVQYQIRKMKMQIEQNMASKLSNDSPIWPWLIQYAAQVIHTFKVHKEDKRTSRQRIRANPSLPEIPKFGEHIYFKPAKTVSIPKDEARWRSGMAGIHRSY